MADPTAAIDTVRAYLTHRVRYPKLGGGVHSIGRHPDGELINLTTEHLAALLDEIERLTEEVTSHRRLIATFPRLRDERAQAHARLDAVRAQHHKIVDQSWPDGHCDYCWDQDTEDYQPWPCDTIRALDSESTKDGK